MFGGKKITRGDTEVMRETEHRTMVEEDQGKGVKLHWPVFQLFLKDAECMEQSGNWSGTAGERWNSCIEFTFRKEISSANTSLSGMQ